VLPSELHYHGRYAPAQLASWEATLAAQLQTLHAALLAALQAGNATAGAAAHFGLRVHWEQCNDLRICRETAAYTSEDGPTSAASPGASASQTIRARCLAAITAVGVQHGDVEAAGLALETDMRDAFVAGFRRGDRVATWKARLGELDAQMARLQAALDEVGVPEAVADASAVREARRALNARLAEQIEYVHKLREACNHLVETLRLLRLGG
jgi:hypothetical protein